MAAASRAWELVLHTIESRLLSGELVPGDHLPPERALASELEVGRSSVREAVRVLEVMGLVRTRTGSGPHAGAIIVATPSGGMAALLRLQVAAQGFRVGDVVQTRLLLETAVVADLATSGADLQAANRLVDAMDADTLAPADFLALDARFHVALAEATGNQVVTAMMAGLRESIESYVLSGLATITDWPAAAQRLRTEHRGILRAINGGDPEAARSRVHSHISDYYSLTQLTGRTELRATAGPRTEEDAR